MKRCPKCNNDFPDDANFCPVDAGHLVPVEGSSDGTPVNVPKVDTGGHELLDGRFALGEIVGGHRTGPVYSAGDKQGSTAMVKLVDAKVFPSQLLKQRTERELKQLERLEHPGVAKVLGHGRREDDLWIASERVDGVPLSQMIAEHGPVGQARAIAILTQIGSALEAAAKLGVTHRDLAPKNVLVAEGDQVKIINFGVPTPGPEGRDAVQGVAGFVAPEQIEGRPVDQRCNIYSLGAIGYVLLTGHGPFTGTVEEILKMHSDAEVPVLGAAQSVSNELSAVLLKSLEKTSSKRFMTLRQFLGDLGKAEGTVPQAAAPAEKKLRSKEANKTLMGVSPIDMEAMLAAKKAGGGEISGSGALLASAATTSIDHEPPQMGEASNSQAVTDAIPTQTPEQAPEEPSAQNASAPAEPQAPAQAPVPTPAPMPEPAPLDASLNPVLAEPQAPVAAAQPMSATVGAAPGGKRKGTKQPAPKPAANKGKFRETMWFKKGELDEAAAAAAAASKPEERVSDKADLMEMDVRYADDGSITQQDQERLSLRTGATMMMEAMPQQGASNTSGVSEDYLVSEMTSGRNKILLGIGAAVLAIGIALALVLT